MISLLVGFHPGDLAVVTKPLSLSLSLSLSAIACVEYYNCDEYTLDWLGLV